MTDPTTDSIVDPDSLVPEETLPPLAELARTAVLVPTPLTGDPANATALLRALATVDLDLLTEELTAALHRVASRDYQDLTQQPLHPTTVSGLSRLDDPRTREVNRFTENTLRALHHEIRKIPGGLVHAAVLDGLWRARHGVPAPFPQGPEFLQEAEYTDPTDTDRGVPYYAEPFL